MRMRVSPVLPNVHGAPTAQDVKDRIAPPANATLYDVWYAKGNRIYQCNPEKTGFQFWYNVQTHAFLYPTQGEEEPFEKPGREIGQLMAAPLNPDQQMASPIDTYPTIYYYPDGSWVGTTKPLATTTKEEGRAERGDANNLDDHLEPVVYRSTDGYLSHATYVIRLKSIDGSVPPKEACTTKGLVINKPFTAFFMFYTDDEGLQQLSEEKIKWNNMVRDYARPPKV
ncbi:uncharacterized protein BYT42DRAFT_593938 [Radiomyces spectabilis]|uniref:uncharacterized protein n=1 Tax=Radiomyces spectabilis TaxID=64574 RepID=UPI00221F0EE5|nr:uncharacterized protein BYT42DRAFT_593938 [Radiomyces spectabilis]KAI8377839.1 hypothetical protein BYT42DRAFT_593938 [Radiomyces spectabilis]